MSWSGSVNHVRVRRTFCDVLYISLIAEAPAMVQHISHQSENLERGARDSSYCVNFHVGMLVSVSTILPS